MRRTHLLVLLLALVLAPGCVLDFSGDDDEDGDPDGSGTSGEAGRVDTGLIESRTLGELSDDETDALCDAIGAAGTRVRSTGGREAFCQLNGLLAGRAAIEDSGLAAARTTCNRIVEDCLDDAAGSLSCSRDALDTWAACELSVGEVEGCLSADNAHVLDQLATVERDGIDCGDLTQDHSIFDADPDTDAACAALDACR